MKAFLKTFAACLILVELFLAFGGWMLFDFNRHYFLTGASVAFLLAVLISIWLAQEERIEKMERRIAALENADSLENKENEP